MNLSIFYNLQNFDLLSVGISTAAIGILGFLTLYNNPKNFINRVFFAMCITAILWSVFNFLSYQPNSETFIIWTLRFAVFYAVWFSYHIFLLFYSFPYESSEFSGLHKKLVLPLTYFISFLTLTPLVFKNILEFSPLGRVLKVENGPGIIAFGLTVIFLITFGIYLLTKKIRISSNLQKKHIFYILFGITISSVLLIIFNYIFPALLDKANYISFGAVFLFPFIAFTSYAIFRFRLFNEKIVTTEVLTFILAIISLVEIIISEDIVVIIFRSITFILILTFGILLIKSVRKEVTQREHIEKLAKELEGANEKLKELDQLKSEFLSLATHQIRAPLTAIKGYASMLLEGDFGVLPQKAIDSVQTIMKSCQNLINIVNDFLNISRIEQGQMVYEKSIFDLGELVKEVANELKPNIQNANLSLELEIPDNLEAKINADWDKIKQVIGNIIDNAIKYTPKGGLKISVSADKETARIAIRDSGVGINPSEVGKLFAKFSRAKDANKTNVIGTGLGLYIAKKMTEAHGGDIKIASEGVGKGTTFTVELPKVV